jgi:anaerobic magnesium-protoporphyrin IX monomethyl ester cyclase
MRILLINPPYQTITSNFGVGHQVPLGLLAIGGPLLDAGHDVKLLDGECGQLSPPAIVRAVQRSGPQIVMTGHAGSTPAHAVCLGTLRAIKAACPQIVTVYGGVYPTYHAARILTQEPAVDFVVRGEGEATAQELVQTLAATYGRGGAWNFGRSNPFQVVRGIAFRAGGEAVLTLPRPSIQNLDEYRVGWELISNWDAYHCFGLGRAAIVQFSRGCPHQCTYCGQHGFWVKWRCRDPVKLADEIAWLHHTHGINFITLADENPTTLRVEWRRFLEELCARRLPVQLFATIRAPDIVRDADLLPLYREAGILYVLMGIESTNDLVLKQINKGSTTRQDYQACRLLKQHGIFSVLGHIVGFEDETFATFRTALRQLRAYDGAYVNVMYVTPHAWTAFGQKVKNRQVVQSDQRNWDYRHQVLSQRNLKPWQLFLAVKWLELCFHLRPSRLWAILRERDRRRLGQWLWTYLHVGLVWLAEIVEFLFKRTPFARRAVTVAEVESSTGLDFSKEPTKPGLPEKPKKDLMICLEQKHESEGTAAAFEASPRNGKSLLRFTSDIR